MILLYAENAILLFLFFSYLNFFVTFEASSNTHLYPLCKGR